MREKDLLADKLILFLILLIGAAETAQLLGVFLHWPFERCAVVFAVLVIIGAAALSLLMVLPRRRALPANKLQESRTSLSMGECLLLILFIALAAAQILYLLAGRAAFVQGDMTVETAASFLESDAIYVMNPMTGRAYVQGLPDRLAILCLPALYAAIRYFLRIRLNVLILQAVPIYTLLCCYGAYYCLARGLFPQERGKRIGFLSVVAFLFWIGSYRYGLDGFDLLFTGWRGITIRNTVLIPYTISLCLRKKYFHLPLCLLAEACIVWTFYGLGACALVISGMGLACFLARVWETGAIWRKEDGT